MKIEIIVYNEIGLREGICYTHNRLRESPNMCRAGTALSSGRWAGHWAVGVGARGISGTTVLEIDSATSIDTTMTI